MAILQPDESQTFYFRYGPNGEEHYFTAKEVLQKMRDYYQQNFDTVIFLPYAYSTFGYFIGGAQIGSGSDDTMLLGNEDYSDLSSRISTNQFVAVSPLYSGTILLRGFNTDGSVSYSFGSIGYNTLYQGPPDGNTIWNFVSGDYDIPFVLYTECECNHLYINGEEWHPPVPVGDANLKITYYVPAGNYEYSKLTYKKDKEPVSVNDGTVVDIDISQTEIIVENLLENSTYYFTIFTDVSESTSVPFKIEPNPVPPEYREYIDYINGSGFFFKDYVNASKESGGETYYTQKYYPNGDYSWFTSSDWPTIKLLVDSNSNAGPINCADIYTVDLVNVGGDQYSYSITPSYKPAPSFSSRYWLPNYWFASATVGYMDGIYCIEGNNGASICEPTWSGTDTLPYIFEYVLKKYCKNINIRVDGVYWSKVG